MELRTNKRFATFLGLGFAAILALGGAVSRAAAQDKSEALESKAAPSAPSKTGFADAKGGRIHYAVYGDANLASKPLLVLHGGFMSGAAMAPLVAPLAASRPVITVDARGHGRTGDLAEPITYPLMADDTASVVEALGLRSVDVLGYSMGSTTAIIMAVRHPDLVDKQIIVSAPAWCTGWQPKVLQSFSKWKPELFAGTPVEASYKRLSATPDAFAAVVDKSRAAEASNWDVSQPALRAIRGKTMIIVGDSDGLDLAQTLRLYKARGGPDPKAALEGFISDAPRARLAILPATSHIGMMNEGSLIARLVTPFLDDRPPPRPSGFFEGVDAPPPKAKGSARER
jgi:pimeloyl-ACP methyl ester carboxylesterase